MIEGQIRHGALLGWEVVSKVYKHEPAGYYEPPEYFGDYRLVYARNRQEAKKLATRSWRRANKWYYIGKMPKILRRKSWILRLLISERLKYYYDEHPYKGLKAEPAYTEEWIEEHYENTTNM